MATGAIRTEACPECGGKGWIVEIDGGAGTAVPCTCRNELVAPKLLAGAGIPERFESCTLDSFKIASPEAADREQLLAAREQCRRYLDNFYADGCFARHGLLFVGPPGVGKTHLAVSVLKELVVRYQVRGRFEDFTALIHRIQATFEPGTVDSKHAILRRVTDAELLVLDDLGAQKLSEWVNEILYLVINTRYNRRLATIFTTNLRLEADRKLDRERDAEPLSWRIPDRLVSRLHEMAKVVPLGAGDFRREILREKVRAL